MVNIYPIYLKEVLEDAKSVNGRTDNTIAQILKGQTTIYKTQNTTQKTKHKVTRPHPQKGKTITTQKQPRMNSGTAIN
jgi:ribosomal protein L35AE/L33A